MKAEELPLWNDIMREGDPEINNNLSIEQQ